MKVRLVGLVVLCCTLGLVFCFSAVDKSQSQTNKGASSTALSDAERDLLNEINQARAHPQVYASYLEKLKPQFSGKDYTPAGKQALSTQEGWGAVEDAIKFMRAAKPLGPLTRSEGLTLAALALCKDQGGTGGTGHKGSDSAFIEQRLKPFGTWQGGIGENITYGDDSARERVLTWLIDDGFASRGHRMRMMSPNYKVSGLSCGSHPDWGTMCVLELAGGFVEMQAAKAAPTPQTNTAKSNNKAKNARARAH